MSRMVEEGVRYILIQALGKVYKIWTRRVGSNPKVKILLLHGGPGGNHKLLKPFEDELMEDGYELYFYDQLGSYKSDKPTDLRLWEIDRFVDEVEQVRIALGLNKDNFYLFGNSWGGILAMEYALKYQHNLKGMMISSMQASIDDYMNYVRTNLATQMDPESVIRILEIEMNEETDIPEYDKLLQPFYRKFVIRKDPEEMPIELIESLENLNRQIYNYMNGPSEFSILGTLKDWSIRNRLVDIKVPTLFIGSTHNTVDPMQMRWMSLMVDDGRYYHCENGSHLAMWDDRKNYFAGIREFIGDMERRFDDRRRIEAIMRRREIAIEEKDVDLYLTTVTGIDKHLINEQKHWFEAMTSEGMADVRLNPIRVDALTNGNIRVLVRQRHYYYEDFDITYPLIFREERGELKDQGYDFDIIETPRYIIRYMKGDGRVHRLREMIEEAFNRIESIFGMDFREQVEFKLYSNNELLRQRTMPSIKWLFAGWAEQDESIKFYTGLDNINWYKGLIQHELIHMITESISHGHISQWLSEGLAVKYGNADYDLHDDIIFSHMDDFNLHKTLRDVEDFDLYNAKDMDQIREWYGTVGTYVNFLLNSFGHEKVMEILIEADRVSKMYDDDHDPNTAIQITKEAIVNVLGTTEEELTEEYLHMY